MRRVVVTGLGVISPIGNNIKEFKDSLKSGKNGISRLTKVKDENIKIKVAGQIKGINFEDYIDKKELRRLDEFSTFALIASMEAIKDAKLLESSIDKNKIGVYIGSGIGGLNVFMKNHIDSINKGINRVSPFFIPSMISNMASSVVAIKYGFKGATLPIVTACATSTNTIGEAYRNIKDGYSDVIIAGGTEGVLNSLTMAGFDVLNALSRNEDPNFASIPFDEERNGFVMGEGAGVLVLEDLVTAQNRGAKIYGEVIGYGNTCDAYHITAPDPDGNGAYRAIKEAIGDNKIDINSFYYNAHGTSTLLNDACETKALKKFFKEDAYKINISSTKSMTGHMLGAAGAVEAIASIIAINENFIPATINTRKTSKDCDLNYTLGKRIDKKVNYALSTSLGFGGHNASILFKKVNNG